MIGYFNDIVRAATEADRVQASKDWHNDISGVDTGRITRTVIDHPDSDLSSRNRKNGDTLDIILASAVDYDQLFAATKQRATDTGNQIEALQKRIETALASEQLAMQQLGFVSIKVPNPPQNFLH